MKTIAIFLLVLVLTSCTTDNLEIEKNENIQIDSKNGSENQAEISNLYYGLDRISYIVGRVLLKHVDARNQVVILLTSSITIDLASLLDPNNPDQSFKIAFDNEVLLYEQDLWGKGCCAVTGGGVRPKPQEIPEYFSLSNFINENCFELYFPTIFDFSHLSLSPQVNITPHPLADNSWPTGFVLWQNPFNNYNEGYYTVFNNFMLNKPNVIVVRPKRNDDCQYNFVPVIDFTTFLDFTFSEVE